MKHNDFEGFGKRSVAVLHRTGLNMPLLSFSPQMTVSMVLLLNFVGVID